MPKMFYSAYSCLGKRDELIGDDRFFVRNAI
jgi:hypothetical protein